MLKRSPSRNIAEKTVLVSALFLILRDFVIYNIAPRSFRPPARFERRETGLAASPL